MFVEGLGGAIGTRGVWLRLNEDHFDGWGRVKELRGRWRASGERSGAVTFDGVQLGRGKGRMDEGDSGKVGC